MEVLLTKEAFEEAVNTDSPMIIDFSAEWCGPCKMLAPLIDGIEGTEKYKVDIEILPELAKEYGVTTVPTVIIFRNGEALDTIIGVQPRPVYEEKLTSLK